MNCESCEEPKNSRTAAAAGLALIRSCGMTLPISTERHALLDRALHAQQADAVLVLHQLADRADAAVAEIVDVVDLALAVAQLDQRLDDREDVLLAQHADGVLGVEVEAHVHLDAADRRKVVALGIEEQRLEHRLRRVDRRRLARAHDAVDVEQRFLARLVLVDGQRVADVGAGIDVVDVENRDLVVAELDQLRRAASRSARRRPRHRSRPSRG